MADLGWFLGFHGTPLLARSTTLAKDSRLNGNPLSGQKPKKTASVAHPSMLYQQCRSITDQLTGRARSFSPKCLKMSVVAIELWMWPLKIACIIVLEHPFMKSCICHCSFSTALALYSWHSNKCKTSECTTARL